MKLTDLIDADPAVWNANSIEIVQYEHLPNVSKSSIGGYTMLGYRGLHYYSNDPKRPFVVR